MDQKNSEIEQLKAENELLKEKAELLGKQLAYYRRDNERLHNALSFEHNESDNAKDAERYRWLRHAIFNNPQNVSPFPEKEIEHLIANGMSEEDSLDYAIDAAMEGGE